MARRKKGQPISGWVILDKPCGLSSTQALSRVRWLFDAQKAGHGGTLDPLATGVLPLAFGEATKTLPFIEKASKTYQFTVSFGTATTTDDAEGEVTTQTKYVPPIADVKAALKGFTGEIFQIPPAYSALKIDGQRAYKKARAGEDVHLEPRQVTIHTFKFIDAKGPLMTFEAEVSKGTYIRSLGRDLAVSLGSCGHIHMLRRTAVGKMGLQDAVLLEDIEKKVASLGGKGHIPPDVLLPVDWVLDDIPAHTVTKAEAQKLGQGLQIVLPKAPQGLVRAKTEEGVLVSLLEVLADKSTKVVRNFNDIA